MNKKIAFILKADSLERDDRVRKEALALINSGYQVKIFLNFGDNIERCGETSYGVKYESVKLLTRDKLPSSKGLIFKAIEFYFKLLKRIKSFDVVWSHEEYSFLFPLLNFTKKHLVWDLHEYPARFSSKHGLLLLRLCERGASSIVHANVERFEISIQNKLFVCKKKHFVLNNYPDTVFMDESKNNNFTYDLELWLAGDNYVYLQGLATSGRYPFNTVSAFLKANLDVPLKAIVVGYFDDDSKCKLEEEYGESLYERVLFLGAIDQLDIPKYISKSLFTIVLYKENSVNNMYCEPNRLYQSLNLGVPAITGCNPTMSRILLEHKSGIALDNDGEDLKSLSLAIEDLVRNIGEYRVNASFNSLEWSDSSVRNIVHSFEEHYAK